MVLAAASCLPTGCAEFALRPPTPATQLDSTVLNYPAPAERFYVLVFAAQSVPRLPALTHTWATVVRVADCHGRDSVLEAHTISWLPASLNIRALNLTVEPATNLDLHQSLAYAINKRERISMWGPYECQPSFFRRFLVQKQFLESGQIGYQCDDNLGEAGLFGNGCCCIHAISDMNFEYGRSNYPLVLFGDAGSERIVNRLHQCGSLVHPEIEHDRLIDALGLKAYPIRHRHLHDRVLAPL